MTPKTNIFDSLPYGANRKVARLLKVTENTVTNVRTGYTSNPKIRKALMDELEKKILLDEREKELAKRLN